MDKRLDGTWQEFETWTKDTIYLANSPTGHPIKQGDDIQPHYRRYQTKQWVFFRGKHIYDSVNLFRKYKKSLFSALQYQGLTTTEFNK